MRERSFTPRLRFNSYDELMPGSWTNASPGPGRTAIPSGPTRGSGKCSRRSGQAHFLSRPLQRVPLDSDLGVEDLPRSVRQQQIYSVSASAAGRPVDIHAYAERVLIRRDGGIVAEHPRRYGRAAQRYIRSWRYVPILTRKPRALRNGAPFKDWVLPTALERVRRSWLVPRRRPSDGQDPRRRAERRVARGGSCLPKALSEGVHSADVLARQRDPGPAVIILTPDALRLRHAPIPTAPRYDQLRNSEPMGTKRTPRHDGRPQALRDEERLRRDIGHCAQTPACLSASSAIS